MPALFAATIFVSATLLFMVQPMVGKIILPRLGGSPAAWNTCMVFFQNLLLLGYLYAHNLTKNFAPRMQTRVHLAAFLVGVAWLGGSALFSPAHSPIAVLESLAPQGQTYPVFGVLLLLAVAVGIPFWLVSTSAPLLQRWFTSTGHPSARDPYFLYAASNAGSLISLLGYPFLIEPNFSLNTQTWIWAGGFAVLMVLVARCGSAATHPIRPPVAETVAESGPPPTWPRRLRWLGLAFVPSSLMLGVTFHMTTDIASVPLLWVIPLALYLLTFIIAFARTPSWFSVALLNISPVLTLLLVFIILSRVLDSYNQVFYLLLAHIVVYFTTSLMMHTDLARLRPAPKYLTEYYLWISVGGMLGGLFNALIAPLIFPIPYEYPIAIALGCMLLPKLSDFARPATEPPPAKPPAPERLPWLAPALMSLVFLGVMIALRSLPGLPGFAGVCETAAGSVTKALAYFGIGVEVYTQTVRIFVVYALPCMACFFFIDRPVVFGTCVAIVFGVNYYWSEYKVTRERQGSPPDVSVRTYFGIIRIDEKSEPRTIFRYLTEGDEPNTFIRHDIDTNEKYHQLMHGTTMHGMQAVASYRNPISDDLRGLAAATPWDTLVVEGALNSWDFRQEPLTYYHRTGPVGMIVERLRDLNPKGQLGMVGLGTGSMACYALPGQSLTFYEIDKAVVDIVEAGKYFTFVNDAKKRGAAVDMVLGDARLSLKASAARYDLLLIDAFSSDAIPVHLLTQEAVKLYTEHLTEHGLLAVHISNRYIELEPVVARLALDAGLSARICVDEKDQSPGKAKASWILLARSDADLGDKIAGDFVDLRIGAVAGPLAYLQYTHPWQRLKERPQVKAWRDDFSDVLLVMNLKQLAAIRRFLGLPVLERPAPDE